MKTSALKRSGFTRSQRKGILALSALVLLAQLFCLLPEPSLSENKSLDAARWLSLQKEIDSLRLLAEKRKPAIYPFNPNFISDHKGYRLGMSIAEIDRLLDFRKSGKFVNSAREFQQVTKVSDSLLAAISPFFKFPDWVRNRHLKFNKEYERRNRGPIVKSDINEAGKEQLMAVYGIGDALSDRIIKQRELLGGFVEMSQMDLVWGLSAEVVRKLKERFDVKRIPDVKKIRINDASVKELAAFPYFRYALAKSIVTHRSMNGKIVKPDDLVEIENFPVENVKIISLYLEF